MNRRDTVLVLIALGLVPIGALAQRHPSTIPRIGYLSSETASDMANRLEALRAGLRDLGYVEGRNIVIEVRRAGGNYDRLPDLAAELVRLKVDLLVAEGIKAGLAAKRATTTIPIVLPGTADPVEAGAVGSIARPGGNLTGSTAFGTELAVKRLELLKEAVPRISKVAILSNPANPNSGPTLEALEAAAKSLKMGLQKIDVRAPTEFDSAFEVMAKSRLSAVLVLSDTMFVSNVKAIALLAAAKRLPLAGRVEFADAGGLIGYGVNSPDMYRRSAAIVDKILKGAKPADLPIERATNFELVVNRKAGKALGITIPPALLVRADRVIE